MKQLTVNTGNSTVRLGLYDHDNALYGIVVAHMVIVHFLNLEQSRGTRQVSARLGWRVTLERCTTESAVT